MTVLITIRGSAGALVGALYLLYFIVAAFLNGFTFIVDQCGSRLAHTHLTAAILAIPVVPCTIRTFSSRDLIMAALLDGLTEPSDASVSIVTDACWVAIVLEPSALQGPIFRALDVYLLVRWTFLLAPTVYSGVSWATDALLVALVIAFQMATLAARACRLEDLVLVAVFDLLTGLSDQRVSCLAHAKLLAIDLTISSVLAL